MDVFTRVAVMDAFFASVAESFDKLGRDIAATFDRVGVDYNRSTSAAQRAETAAKTGIVSEHDAGLSSLPSYVVELGARARVVDVSANAVAALPENLGALVKAHKLNAARNALVSLPESLCSMASLRVLRLEGAAWSPSPRASATSRASRSSPSGITASPRSQPPSRRSVSSRDWISPATDL